MTINTKQDVAEVKLDNSFPPLFRLNLPQWTAERKVRLPDDAIHRLLNRPPGTMSPLELTLARKNLGLDRRLVDSPELEACIKYSNSIRTYCLARCSYSFLDSGLYAVRPDYVETLDRFLEDSRMTLGTLVEEFLSVYPKQRDETLAGPIKDFVSPSDYPSESTIRARFGVNWRYIQFAVPEGLPPEIRRAQEEALRRDMQEAKDTMLAALREAFLELVAHATERLDVQPGEKKKRFNNSLIENLGDFFETFQQRNVLGDEKLAQLVTQAKAILGNTSPDDLRDDARIRNRIRTGFETVKQQISALVQEQPRRKFNLDDEQEAA